MDDISMTKRNSLVVTLVVVVVGLAALRTAEAELERVEQPRKADGTVSFLVVGDWGRKGNFNQSLVAHQEVVAHIRQSTLGSRRTDYRIVTASGRKRRPEESTSEPEAPTERSSSLPHFDPLLSDPTQTHLDELDVDYVAAAEAHPPQGNLPEQTPYGLDDPSVLRDFEGHIADAIWRTHGPWRSEFDGHVRRITCQSRPREFASWRTHIPSSDVDAAEGSWLWIIRQTGLTELLDFDFGNVDHALISAFVERWHPETNSFHFPWGEITITLHDVAVILGLPIEGHEVAHTFSFPECTDLVEYMFGTREDYLLPGERDFLSGLRKGRLHSRDFFDHVLLMMASDDPPECIAAGFLWHAMSTSLFVDKSTNNVDVRMLPLFEDWGRVVETAWGTGTLAFLYRHLGEASRRGVAQMAGCTYLLQMWIWMYFVYFPGNPNPLPGAEDDERRARRYRVDRTRLQTDETSIYYRRILDSYRPEDVCWTPYPRVDLDVRYPTSRYRGTIRFMDIYEPYMPERCVRQWGRVQSRPLDVIVPRVSHRPWSLRGRATYFLHFEDEYYGWGSVMDHICPFILTSPGAVTPWDVDDEYLDWFLQISHPYVSPSAPVRGLLDEIISIV